MDWNRIPDEATIQKTIRGLEERNFNPEIISDRNAAFNRLKELIPDGADVMTGSSTTLDEIGFIKLLTSKSHPWRNWKDRILSITETDKQLALRRQSTTATYFLGSVQAITEGGIVVGTDATGSRQGGYVFSATNVIWVAGVNKIVGDITDALRRIREHCVPLEDARMKSTGALGTFIGKLVIYEREAFAGRIRTILVREKLGF